MPNLSWTDVAAILLCWVGAGTIVYLTKDGLVAIICVAAAYYLAKWIILKKEAVHACECPDEEDEDKREGATRKIT